MALTSGTDPLPPGHPDLRRLVRLTLAGEAFPWLFTPGRHAYRVHRGLPEGAELVSAFYSPCEHRLVAVFRHPDFPVVPEGSPVLELDVDVSDLPVAHAPSAN